MRHPPEGEPSFSRHPERSRRIGSQLSRGVPPQAILTASRPILVSITYAPMAAVNRSPSRPLARRTTMRAPPMSAMQASARTRTTPSLATTARFAPRTTSVLWESARAPPKPATTTTTAQSTNATQPPAANTSTYPTTSPANPAQEPANPAFARPDRARTPRRDQPSCPPPPALNPCSGIPRWLQYNHEPRPVDGRRQP